MKRYFAYIRVSNTYKQGTKSEKDGAKKGSSLEEQQAAVEAYARRNNLTIVEWFKEEETAAKRGRRLFNRMLAGLARNRADGVIMHKIDRGARNLRDWADLGDLLDRGVEVLFAHDNLDLRTRGGRLAADIQAIVAADYIRNLRDEVRKGFNGRLKQGLWPLGAPIGYLDQGKGKAKTIDPVQGPIVAQAFELYATGKWSLETIGEELHRRGLRNKRGGPVTRTGLSTILNNPFYTGRMRIKKTGEYFQGVHTPLISMRVFESVRAVLRGRTQHQAGRHRFRYQRALHCTTCGLALIAERQKGHVYYRCHTKSCAGACLREEKVNEALRSAAPRFRLTDTEWDALKADVERGFEDRKAAAAKDVEALVLSIAAVDGRLARLTDGYVDHLIDREAYVSRREQLVRQRAELVERKAEREAGDHGAKHRAGNILELLKTLGNLPDLPNDDELRDLLKQTTSNLGADKKNVVIAWAQPFNRLAMGDPVSNSALERAKPRTRRDVLKSILDFLFSDTLRAQAENATSTPLADPQMTSPQ